METEATSRIAISANCCNAPTVSPVWPSIWLRHRARKAKNTGRQDERDNRAAEPERGAAIAPSTALAMAVSGETLPALAEQTLSTAPKQEMHEGAEQPREAAWRP